MRICPACNSAQADTARFCAACGAQLPLGGAVNAAPVAGTPAKTSGLAIAALVLAIFPCTCFIGMILGIVSLVQINGRPRELSGKGLAIAGIVIPAFWFVMILPAIAIPNFIKFQARSKQSEAKSMLRSIYAAERAYEADTGKHGADFDTIGFKPETKRRYAYFFHDSVLEPDLGGPYAIPEELRDAATAPNVVAVAVGNIDSDPQLDVWIVDSSGAVTSLRDDVND